ncbi:succinic semialdehyde dehydrogenase [Natrinema longum]|uniref:Succinate-semialdehyde dehydrogenase (NADP(+)) n=1 Tax=Natrinema longum TaxID=370324 RepID=A0A8A2UGP9_9EURY|nr:succinic semialdehyde dehydrogenase [Natrinema longum]MBZ6495141.1 succinate-semialdehyde dehydrogenase (NADP(+)) [Natrinema longum]QSW86875.1 succinate-semialdehyde dehydrogenase (NADP(+)) [Natrinema longum]
MSFETESRPRAFAETNLSAGRLETLADRVETDGTDTIDVRAPATDTRIGSIPDCTEADVERAIDRARTAQPSWADTPVDERGEILDRFGDLVLAHREELLDLLQLETGKSRRHAVEEVVDVAVTSSYYAEHGAVALAEERRQGVFPLATTARVTYEPVGVVGAISPWNYPLTLSVTDLLPALVAGNAAVLKPDDKTPYTALALAELLERAGLPDGCVEVVTGQGPVVGPALIDRVDYVSFTGSTETGRLVAEQAGRNLIDCSLELGGKNPLVVLDDADVETAARGAVQACFTNAGQLCLAAERIYVAESIRDAFLDAFVAATERLSLGTGFDFEADVGSLIDGDQLERVETHVDDARERGASVRTGGTHRPDVGPFYYEPTILTDLDPDATAACEETFGPVVAVESVPDVGTAIERANDSEYGLNASVWTGNRERGVAVAREIDCGTVCVNDAYISGWAAVDAPMGGFGDSGLGRRHGPEGIERYLESRTVATSRIGPLDAPPGVPTSWYARGMFTLTRLQRRLPTVSDIKGRLR